MGVKSIKMIRATIFLLDSWQMISEKATDMKRNGKRNNTSFAYTQHYVCEESGTWEPTTSRIFSEVLYWAVFALSMYLFESNQYGKPLQVTNLPNLQGF